MIYREKTSVKILYLAVTAAICLILAGCFSSNGGGTVVENPGMTTFSDYDDLENYIKEQYAESVLDENTYRDASATMVDVINEQTPASGGDGALSDEYSQTNIQEEGVDEADMVKNNGMHLYIAGNQVVHIIEAVSSPGEMQLVNQIEINGNVDLLYLYGDILVVLYTPDGGGGSQWDCGCTSWSMDSATAGLPYWVRINVKKGVKLINISDPSAPIIIKDIISEGDRISSRIVDGKLHIIQQYLPALPKLTLYYDSSEKTVTDVIEENKNAIDSIPLEQLVPLYEMFDSHGDMIENGFIISAEDFYRPSEPGGGTVVSILTFFLDNPSQHFQSTGIIADAHRLYTSTQALYLTSTQWSYNTENAINDRSTIIHKFDITGDKVEFKGSGSVPGSVLNQFSMGEYQNVLRMATNSGTTWTDGGMFRGINNIYCLRESDNKLEIIGKIEGIAPGERIYSARFIGPRGFLVTFVKIDPLFTLDLSSPESPTIVGELKVPGYSDYIHPLGDNHLLTIGKDVTLDGDMAWYQGLQLSIFDISDFAKPQLVHKELIGDRGTGSEALSNHKAFTFWAEKDLLAFPVDLYEHDSTPDQLWEWGEPTYAGLYVYNVKSGEGFNFLGRISSDNQGYSYYYPFWTRGIFINDDVYSVQDITVKRAETDNIENTITSISLSGE